MPSPIPAAWPRPVLRGLQLLGASAVIAAFGLLSMDAIARYMGVAAYYRYERSWHALHDEPRADQAASAAFERHVAWLTRSLRFAPGQAYAHYALGREYLDKPAASGAAIQPSAKADTTRRAGPTPSASETSHPAERAESASVSDLERAQKHLRRAIDLQCTSPEYHSALGMVYSRMADASGTQPRAALLKEAVRELSLACDLDLGHPRYPISLGDLFASRGMRACAIAMYRIAFARNTRSCKHWRTADERAIDIMRRTLALRSSFLDLESVVGDTLPRRMQIAQFLGQEGHSAHANAMLIRAAGITQTGDLDTRSYIALRLVDTRAPRSAIRVLSHWLGTPPPEQEQPDFGPLRRVPLADLQANLPLYMALARAYDVAGRPKHAIEVNAIICQRIDPVENPRPAYALAQRYLTKGRDADAIALLAQWRKERDARLGRRSPYRTNECEALEFLGQLYSTSQQHEEAAQVYEALVDRGDVAKRREHWQRQLSDSYLRLNRVADALASYRAAVQRNPQSAAAHCALAAAYERTGDLARAVREYRAAAKLEPNNAAYAEAARKARLRIRLGK